MSGLQSNSKFPRLLPAGDSAVLIEWADSPEISDEANDRVHAFAQTLRNQNSTAITDLIAAYSSLLVNFDPRQLPRAQILSLIQEILQIAQPMEDRASRLVEIPTRYGGEFGPDLAYLAQHHQISEHEVIELHVSAVYRVYMLGFVPGFAYLGSVPEQIAAPRLETPRTRVPAGSVGIAGRQTGVYPLESPGGWRLIGHTDVQLFDPNQDPPTLLRPGDRVRFVKV